MMCCIFSLYFVYNGLVINILNYKYWLWGPNYSEDVIVISVYKLALEIRETFMQQGIVVVPDLFGC